MDSIDIKYNETLSSRLEHLVGNKFCSDLTFVIEDTNEEIPAHKLIVALSSPVLHRIVYGNETFPSSDVIRVNDISKESFMQILLYIYTDRINLNEDNVFDIFQKSNYYGLPAVESKCLEYLEQNLSISTVPWIYHQLFFSASSRLLSKCLQYIRIQPLKFFASEYFEKISVDELKSVFESDAINCTEVDLFGAMIRLSRAHCAAANLEITAKNQRKILDGTEKLLRLESLTESELDQCLALQSDFFTTAEVKRFRDNIRNASAAVKVRQWYTYQDSVWIEVNTEDGEGYIPPSSFYAGFRRGFIHRYSKRDKEPHVMTYPVFSNSQQDVRVDVLCGSGYEWQKCVNGEIPIGAVPISLKYSEPVFIARESDTVTDSCTIGTAYMNGKMKLSTDDYDDEYDDDDDEEEDHDDDDDQYCDEFEILVGKNVKHPYTGDGVPADAIFIGYDENNDKTYLGRAWCEGDLLPAKVISRLHHQEAYVSYGGNGLQIDEFEFFRMDPGTFKWEESMNGEVPKNAVIGGCTDYYENLYFGRKMHNGNYIPGKIHPSHRVLYVAFGGQEINFQSYEVLVHVRENN